MPSTVAILFPAKMSENSRKRILGYRKTGGNIEIAVASGVHELFSM